MTFLLCTLYLLVLGAGLVSMAVLCLRGKKARYNMIYLVCQGLAVLWCASQIFLLLASDQLELYATCLLGNAGICFVGTFWFYFAKSYTQSPFRPLEKYLPFLLSCFHYGMVLTNPWHHLYYSVFRLDEIEHNIFFYTNVFVTYILVLSGGIRLYRFLAQQKGSRKARWLVIASGLVPVSMNLIYVTGVLPVSFDITPLGFGISALCILLATIRYRFMEVNITAFDAVLSGLSHGVAVFDRKGRCTYTNAAFYQLVELGEVRGKLPGLEKVKNWVETLTLQEKLPGQGGQVFLDRQERYLQVQFYQPLATADREGEMVPVGIEEILPQRELVFVLQDMSHYYQLVHQTRELAVTNEKLALERERNRIAGQVHDTAGHTLTMIQSYMKLALVASGKQEQREVDEYLVQAKTMASEGIRELRQSINQMRKEASYELVTQGLMQLADQVKEIPIELTVQGEDSEEYSHLSGILYDCTREAITNTLKYAEASRMDIIVRFQEQGVELVIGDDGKGCDQLKENNGIRGIRERVEGAGGQVKCISSQGEGFLIRIKLPLQG